jgi:ribose 5-phosphate isomerase RpiB
MEFCKTRLKQCIAYADDVLITAQTKQTVKDTFQQLMHNSIEFGLIINEEKTKYLNFQKKKPEQIILILITYI